MSKNKKLPNGYQRQEQWDDFLNSLERSLAGARARVAELEAMDAANPRVLAEARSAVDGLVAQLADHGRGQKNAAKRPAKAREKRG